MGGSPSNARASLRVDMNRGERWQAIRRVALNRDGWRCTHCGRAGALEVDHVQPLEKGGAPYALDNLQTLCRECHKTKSRRDRGLPERSPESKRWREFVKDLTLSPLR